MWVVMVIIILFIFVYLLRQLRAANETEEQLRVDCMKYKEVLESRSSAVAVSTQCLVVILGDLVWISIGRICHIDSNISPPPIKIVACQIKDLS